MMPKYNTFVVDFYHAEDLVIAYIAFVHEFETDYVKHPVVAIVVG